MVYCGHFGS